jgi:hydrogenase maturation protease
MESKRSRMLVVGLGNPTLGDDGVGWKVAEELKRQLPPDLPVEVDCLSLGGVSLMEHLIGYDCAILIDAFALEEPIGSILILKLGDLPNYSAFHTASAHDIPLQKAIEMGKSMGAQLPDDVTVVGIATKRLCDFSRELSPPVAEAVPQAAKFALDLLSEKIQVYKK